MKTKAQPQLVIYKPDPSTEAKPLKSLRPMRSLNGIKSLRPKNVPVVAAQEIQKLQ